MAAIAFFTFFISVVLGLIFIWIRTILEIADTEMEDTSLRIIWMLFVFFMPVVGVCCWYVFGRKRDRNERYA